MDKVDLLDCALTDLAKKPVASQPSAESRKPLPAIEIQDEPWFYRFLEYGATFGLVAGCVGALLLVFLSRMTFTTAIASAVLAIGAACMQAAFVLLVVDAARNLRQIRQNSSR